MTTIKTQCPICGKESNVEVEFEDYLKFQNGELIHNCFPYLSIEDREKLITGICGKCWNTIFNESDDDI